MDTRVKLARTAHDRFVTKWKRRFGRVFTDPRWARYYIQLKLPDPRHRQFVASAVSKFLPRGSSRHSSDPDLLRLVQDLNDIGSVPLGVLSREKASAIRAYFVTKRCYDPFRPEAKGFSNPEAAHRSCIHAYFPKADVAEAPHVLELANHPRVLSAVEAYFGVKPVIGNISAWWLLHGFDVEANTHDPYVCRPDEFHRDLDDFIEVKLFVYLTDVDETAGPHAIIRGSHKWRLPRGQRILQLTDPDYPVRENLQLITGGAGLAWLENSLTLHRGTIPNSKHRLMLTVAYTLLPIALGPKEPLVARDGRSFDPYVNRVLMGS